MVVQLPVDVGTAVKKGSKEDDGAAVIYQNEENTEAMLLSGWAMYKSGANGGRAQGTVAISKGLNMSGDHKTIELANKWLERLGGETEEMVNEAIGRIRKRHGI